MKNKELVKVQIPEGYTAKIEDNEVRIVKVENEFRDGDFVVEKTADCPFIYKGTDNAGFYLFHAGLNICHALIMGDDEGRFGNGPLRAATAEEKQELEDALAGKGLFWNAKEKRIEKKRWRAELGDIYYTIYSDFTLNQIRDSQWGIDDERYNIGNYFRSKEQAEKAVAAIKETLKKFHGENC